MDFPFVMVHDYNCLDGDNFEKDHLEDDHLEVDHMVVDHLEENHSEVDHFNLATKTNTDSIDDPVGTKTEEHILNFQINFLGKNRYLVDEEVDHGHGSHYD